MTVLGFLFFAAVLAVAVWSILLTIMPRKAYISALLSGSTAAPVLVPVAQRRRVRRIEPATARVARAGLLAAA